MTVTVNPNQVFVCDSDDEVAELIDHLDALSYDNPALGSYVVDGWTVTLTYPAWELELS